MTFRLAAKRDISSISAFLKEHWKTNHVFVRNPKLLEWQHRLPGTDALNFVLAEKGAELEGILGFVNWRTPATDGDSSSVALALWKVSDQAGPGVGVQMLRYLGSELQPNRIFSMGVSVEALPIYQALGFLSGVVPHFFIQNPDKNLPWNPSETALAIPNMESPRILEFEGFISHSMRRSLEYLTERPSPPQESLDYLNHRYVRHPVYKYKFLHLGGVGHAPHLIVIRQQKVGPGFIWRVVEAFGSPKNLSSCARPLQELVISSGAYYVDLLAIGLDAELMLRGGFGLSDDLDGGGLPHHFNPLEFDAPSLNYVLWENMSHNEGEARVIYLGQTDQDRPS